MVNSEGKWAKGEIPSQLPAVTSEDEGDVLMVDSEGKWGKGEIPSQLPAVTAEDTGKVLAVNSNGEWASINSSSFVYYRMSGSGGQCKFDDTSMTYGKLKEAVDAGKVVCLIDPDKVVLFPCEAEYPHNGSYPLRFYGVKISVSSSNITSIEHHSFEFSSTSADAKIGTLAIATTTFN